MALVTARQQVTLYQVGDTVESQLCFCPCNKPILLIWICLVGASFNNLLDALDGDYCTFEGGDDATQDASYPDDAPGGYKGIFECFMHLFLQINYGV